MYIHTCIVNIYDYSSTKTPIFWFTNYNSVLRSEVAYNNVWFQCFYNTTDLWPYPAVATLRNWPDSFEKSFCPASLEALRVIVCSLSIHWEGGRAAIRFTSSLSPSLLCPPSPAPPSLPSLPLGVLPLLPSLYLSSSPSLLPTFPPHLSASLPLPPLSSPPSDSQFLHSPPFTPTLTHSLIHLLTYSITPTLRPWTVVHPLHIEKGWSHFGQSFESRANHSLSNSISCLRAVVKAASVFMQLSCTGSTAPVASNTWEVLRNEK